MTASSGGIRPLVLVKAAAVGVAVLAAGVLMQRAPEATPGREFWPWVVVVGALVVLAVVLVAMRGRTGSAGTVNRWSRRSHRNEGVASRWMILRRASRLTMRVKATVVRPSLRQWPFWQRWTMRTREVATPLARVGWLRIWSSVEDVTLRLGGPRSGKTGELAERILDAPGAVITTSTRKDLVELTSACRSRTGPVRVFNPSNVGEIASTVTFDPLSGCAHPPTAVARAEDLVSAVSTPGQDGDGQYWAGQARRVLAALLHAAALGDATMRDVLAWVSDPDSAQAEVQRFLRRSPEPAFELDALQFLGTNERTRSSICATIMPTLGWLSNAAACAAADKGDFDVAALLAERGTVHMLGAEDAQVAPLVTALTGHIAREARRLAETQPGGRLDPPLTLALDEAALICPVPLDRWTADMGGRGVTMHIAAQGRSQLKQRWGAEGAGTILNNAATVVLYGGMRDSDDLAAYSSLTGERYEDVPTWGEDGHVHSHSTRRVPVLTAAQIAQLPPGRVVLIRRNMPIAVGRVHMAWKRHDVKAAARLLRRSQRLHRWGQAWLRFAETVEAWASQDKFATARGKLGIHLDIDRANTRSRASADGDGGDR